jgi:hypothetical protein
MEIAREIDNHFFVFLIRYGNFDYFFSFFPFSFCFIFFVFFLFFWFDLKKKTKSKRKKNVLIYYLCDFLIHAFIYLERHLILMSFNTYLR